MPLKILAWSQKLFQQRQKPQVFESDKAFGVRFQIKWAVISLV